VTVLYLILYSTRSSKEVFCGSGGWDCVVREVVNEGENGLRQEILLCYFCISLKGVALRRHKKLKRSLTEIAIKYNESGRMRKVNAELDVDKFKNL